MSRRQGQGAAPGADPRQRARGELRARIEGQMPGARIELMHSRAPFLAEPLPAAAIGWICVLTASALPERQPYPALYDALEALLDAICSAPSARAGRRG
jgi:DNA repair protein RecO (recombination protein O)